MSDDPKANGDAGNPAIDPTEPRPIWSDDGDAPFDMGDDPEALDSDKPIYATPRPKKAKRVKKEKSASNETVEIIKTIVFALLIAFVLRVLLFQYQEEQIPLQELEAICKSGFAASGKST